MIFGMARREGFKLLGLLSRPRVCRHLRCSRGCVRLRVVRVGWRIRRFGRAFDRVGVDLVTNQAHLFEHVGGDGYLPTAAVFN